MKKFLYRFICFSIGLYCFLWCSNFNCFAFDKYTHEYVTKVATSELKKINYNSSASFFDQNSEKILFEYSTRPDIDENDGAFQWHFYNPATEKNFKGKDISAVTKFEEHYNNSIRYYKENNKEMSLQEIARALHFLEDLNTPVHTNAQSFTDAIIQFVMHSKFEELCNNVKNNYVCSMSLPELYYYRYNSTKTIAILSANLANENFFAMQSQVLTKSEVAGNSIINAQKAACGTLAKYLTDIYK